MPPPAALQRIWHDIRTWLARLLRRAPPPPGRFEEGTKFSWRGWLGVAPWIWPRRKYLVYVPQGHAGWRRRPLLVLVHGCHQSPEDIATGTRVAELADAIGCIVLLPRQNPHANAWGCWNWFDRRTIRGAGETAILAAQIRSVRRRYRVDRKRVFAAGLSAGAGLVAVLAMRNAGLLAGVFLHSGIAAGAASSPVAALSVLKRGPDADVVALARQARAEAGSGVHAVPTCVVHGRADAVVNPVHATEIIRSALAFAADPRVLPAPAELPVPDREQSSDLGEGRSMITREWRHEGRLIARLVLVERLGHAWSGGNAQLRFNDPRPPEATALLRAFMADASAARPHRKESL